MVTNEHKNTYEGFIKSTKIGVVASVAILVLLAAIA